MLSSCTSCSRKTWRLRLLFLVNVLPQHFKSSVAEVESVVSRSFAFVGFNRRVSGAVFGDDFVDVCADLICLFRNNAGEGDISVEEKNKNK